MFLFSKKMWRICKKFDETNLFEWGRERGLFLKTATGLWNGFFFNIKGMRNRTCNENTEINILLFVLKSMYAKFQKKWHDIHIVMKYLTPHL